MSIRTPCRISPRRQRRDLADHKLVLMTNGKDYYLPLRDGAVLHAYSADMDYLGIQLIAYSLIAIAALLPLLLWVWMHWRDLRVLEDAARGFGAGNLGTRANLRKRSNVYALARQFDEMAERIQGSIQHQREMMNGISHELKTPIARLEFGIALLQSPESEAQRNVRLDALRRDVRELDELVSELLALSRLEQGATHLVLMRVAVGEWLDSVVASVANDVADRQLTLAVHADTAPAHHVCDPRLLARALLNRGMPDQVVGTVRIHTHPEGEEPGLWWGSRLAVHAAFRQHGRLGATLIRLAVSSAHARGALVFLAHVQAQNVPLFQRLHWSLLKEETLHGRPHALMQADLAHYPPCHDPLWGYSTQAPAAPAGAAR